MTDELKDKLRQLVADPPPPTGVPSEVLFERVRTVRRRRTAGAATVLATAAVAAVALVSGTLAGPDSAPPVTNTPSGPETIVTGPPTVTPTPKPSSPPAKSPIDTAATPPPRDPSSPVDTAYIPPPTDPSSRSNPSSPSDTSPSILQPVRVTVRLTPTIDGLTVTMRFRESGTMLRPVIEETGKSVAAPTWRNNAYMTGYTWGDGTPGAGANAGLLTCKGAYQRITGSGTDTARDPHTYAAPGTYTFTYTFWYCGPDGVQKTTKTMRLTVG
jgi:hypothetical protein